MIHHFRTSITEQNGYYRDAWIDEANRRLLYFCIGIALALHERVKHCGYVYRQSSKIVSLNVEVNAKFSRHITSLPTSNPVIYASQVDGQFRYSVLTVDGLLPSFARELS